MPLKNHPHKKRMAAQFARQICQIKRNWIPMDFNSLKTICERIPWHCTIHSTIDLPGKWAIDKNSRLYHLKFWMCFFVCLSFLYRVAHVLRNSSHVRVLVQCKEFDVWNEHEKKQKFANAVNLRIRCITSGNKKRHPTHNKKFDFNGFVHTILQFVWNMFAHPYQNTRFPFYLMCDLATNVHQFLLSFFSLLPRHDFEQSERETPSERALGDAY